MNDNYYAKVQLELEPELTLEELKDLMNEGLENNTKKVHSPENAQGFYNSLKWLEQFKTIEEVKGALNL
ncbi:MAG: hypothetical protein IKY41_07445 [Clostridia bacterium]|nr:hypothetical protein [Clostridia bacterium]